MNLPFKEDDLVFSNHDGRPFVPDHVTQAWRRLSNKLKLDGIHLHSARHTFASMMIKNGVPVKVLQEMPGHASAQTTPDVYSHSTQELLRQAAMGLDRRLNPEHKYRFS